MFILGKEVAFQRSCDLSVNLTKSDRRQGWAKFSFSSKVWVMLSNKTQRTTLWLLQASHKEASVDKKQAFLKEHIDNLKLIGDGDKIHTIMLTNTVGDTALAHLQLRTALLVEDAILSSPYPYVTLFYDNPGHSAGLVSSSTPFENMDVPPWWFNWIRCREKIPQERFPVVRRNHWEHLFDEKGI